MWDLIGLNMPLRAIIKALFYSISEFILILLKQFMK